MDLIYMNSQKEDVGVLKDYSFDLAFGSDENDFECEVDKESHCCEAGYFLYIEGSEYGGIIDSIEIDTEEGSVKYKGRTWHGILDSKVFSPDTACDHLVVSGEANATIGSLISRIDMKSLFKASEVNSGITISNYKMNRYVTGYEGIVKMLKSVNAKLIIEFRDNMVELRAVPLVDYSEDEQFDTDQISFEIQQNFNPVNHVICLGKGELKDRRIIHLFTDALGNISGTQSLHGINEVCAKYENPNVTTDEELIEGGIQVINDSWNSNSVKLSFNSNDDAFDVGDVIGATEKITKTVVKARISKKIVTIQRNSTSIDYECESDAIKTESAMFPASGTTEHEGSVLQISDWFTLVSDGDDLIASHSDENAPVFEIDSDGNLYVNADGVSFEIDENNNIFCIE